MRIALGSDHRGDDACPPLVEHLRGAGHDVTLHGECDGRSRDYPDLAWAVGRAVSDGAADRGILVCGSGTGMVMAANKVPGVRAAYGADPEQAAMSRRHNDANVLCLSADRSSVDEMIAMIEPWLTAPFDGGRHARRR